MWLWSAIDSYGVLWTVMGWLGGLKGLGVFGCWVCPQPPPPLCAPQLIFRGCWAKAGGAVMGHSWGLWDIYGAGGHPGVLGGFFGC